MLAWCGACCALAEDYPFPGEREWVSKLGDVVKGTFQSCTGAKVAVKVDRKRVEIPLNRLDEEDAALVRLPDGHDSPAGYQAGGNVLALHHEGA